MDLKEQFLSDILVTATEGGINAWAEVVKRLRRHDDSADMIRSVVLRIDLDSDPNIAGLTQAGVERGIQRVLDPSFSVSKQIRDSVRRAFAKLDAGDIDAEAASVIVQAALFGELVYD